MKAEVDVALSDEDVAHIAKAVIAELKAVGGVVNGEAPKTEKVEKPVKPTKPTKPSDAPKPDEPKTEGPTRQVVLEKLNAAAEKLGSKDAAMDVVRKFAPKFTEVPEDKYGELVAALEAAVVEPPADDSATGDGWE